MDRHRDSQWEETLDRELKSLPDRQAPSTLLPRVMAAVQAKARLPWWRRAWRTWPPAAQVLSLVLFSTLLGLVTWVGMHGWSVGAAAETTRVLNDWTAPISRFWSCLTALVNATALVSRKAGGYTLFAVGILCAAMYLSCGGLGTVCYRVASNK